MEDGPFEAEREASAEREKLYSSTGTTRRSMMQSFRSGVFLPM